MMKKYFFISASILAFMLYHFTANSEEAITNMDDSKYNSLTKAEERVIIHKGTERPFSGKYNDFEEDGIYTCKRCDAPLYRSEDKFHSGCGWPSFDDEIAGAVQRKTDADGRRVEILCNNCGGHLGHVFQGEQLTDKNIRHCVNSISMNFVPASELKKKKGEPYVAKAYFAGGCFWGVEYLFEQKDGVISATSGYMGGRTKNPSYKEICYTDTGHLEVVEVAYDPDKVTFEELAKFHFEIHDPTQANGQGPDIGEQYLSAIFYNSDDEKATAGKLIDILKGKGYDVATTLRPVSDFWKAEDYHQNYYDNNKKKPYCHAYKRRF